ARRCAKRRRFHPSAERRLNPLAPLDLYLVHPRVRLREREREVRPVVVRGPTHGQARLTALQRRDAGKAVPEFLGLLGRVGFFGAREKDKELISPPAKDEV